MAAAAEDVDASARPPSISSSENEEEEGGEEDDADEAADYAAMASMPSYPFDSDFHLEFGDTRIEACRHVCRGHPGGTRTIVLFFPGVHGGVGPCRQPGTNFDEDALYPTLARRLADAGDVDCYRCSWPFMRPRMSNAVGGACRVLHHAILQALQEQPEDAETREFRVCFVGHSLGGAVAVHAAEVVARHFGADGTAGQGMEGLEKAIVLLWGICTLNGALDIRQHRLGAFESLRQCRALLVCGDADQVVPPEATGELFKALPSKSRRQIVLPGGTHDLFTFKSQLIDEIGRFIRCSLSLQDCDADWGGESTER